MYSQKTETNTPRSSQKLQSAAIRQVLSSQSLSPQKRQETSPDFSIKATTILVWVRLQICAAYEPTNGATPTAAAASRTAAIRAPRTRLRRIGNSARQNTHGMPNYGYDWTLPLCRVNHEPKKSVTGRSCCKSRTLRSRHRIQRRISVALLLLLRRRKPRACSLV